MCDNIGSVWFEVWIKPPNQILNRFLCPRGQSSTQEEVIWIEVPEVQKIRKRKENKRKE
jgi:hypothetical protein